MDVTMCVPGISLSLVLSLHNTRAASICIPAYLHISSVCCVTRILILDGSSIHSSSTFNSLPVMVAVMDISNMDISIPFINFMLSFK